MYDVTALYDLANQQNIEVLEYSMPANESMSVMDDGGQCYIGMDPNTRDGSIQERVHLAHELGHCVTGSFYNRYSNFDCRQRHENRADKHHRDVWRTEQRAEKLSAGDKTACRIYGEENQNKRGGNKKNNRLCLSEAIGEKVGKRYGIIRSYAVTAKSL